MGLMSNFTLYLLSMLLLKNTESLRLYRDILRACKSFTWKNNAGVPWGEVLKQNARKEFDQARFESDPDVIAKLIYVGRDCLEQTNEKLLKAAKEFESKVDATRNR